LSTPHQDKLEEKLRDALWKILTHWDDMLPKAPSTGTSQKVGGIGPASKAPAPVSVLSLRRETCEILADWADLVKDGCDLNPVIDKNDAKGLARFLETHSEWVAAHEAGPYAVEQIRSLAGQITAIAAPTGSREFVVAMCVVDGCGGILSAHQSPDQTAISEVKCSLNPTHVWPPEQWRLVGAVIKQEEEDARGDDEYLTPERVSARLMDLHGLRVSRQLVRVWAERGHLAPVDRDAAHRQLYSLNAVKVLVEQRLPDTG
jgi:hypothetical protein